LFKFEFCSKSKFVQNQISEQFLESKSIRISKKKTGKIEEKSREEAPPGRPNTSIMQAERTNGARGRRLGAPGARSARVRGRGVGPAQVCFFYFFFPFYFLFWI
jgi:hypothetical protein